MGKLHNDVWVSPLGWGLGLYLSLGARDDEGRKHWSILLQLGPINILTDYEVRDLGRRA